MVIELLHFHFSLSCIGEGNGNPLQCSCLEKPRDGGAWWAAVYGVAHSRTWLKRLSSSSSSRDLTFQVPMQYCSLQHQTLLPYQSLPQLWIVFGLGCFWFGSVSSFFLELFLHWSPVTDWAPTNLGSSSFSVLFLPFQTVHRVLKARILKWLAIPFSSGPHFVRTLHRDLSVLGGPTWHAHSFTELDKAVLHVIKLISFLWLWFSVCRPSDGEG